MNVNPTNSTDSALLANLRIQYQKAPKEQRASIYKEILRLQKQQANSNLQAKREQEEVERYFLQKDSNAFKAGEKALFQLRNYTTNAEQENLTTTLNNLEEKTVYGFLCGYEGLREVRDGEVNHFFTQLKTEWGFKDNDQLIRNTAKLLQDHFSKSPIETHKTLAKSIEQILKHKNLSKQDAIELDKVVYYFRFNEKNAISARGLLPDFEHS